MTNALRSSLRDRRRPGRVALVGGGPGAAGLLTVRAVNALRQADVVVADRLGPSDILELLGDHARLIDVGKRPGSHTASQQQINSMLIEHARSGRYVVRLKGGDPFVFGRGGEEVIACRNAGVHVEVVPGISAALAVPALADIPLTHRGTAAGFHVTTGHDGLGETALRAACDPATTLVVLMGMSQLGHIVEQVLTFGAHGDTPAAIVQLGSTAHQRTVHAALRHLAARAKDEQVGNPAVIVIGNAAAADTLTPAAGRSFAETPDSSLVWRHRETRLHRAPVA